jgi:hypothetical protein
MTLFTHTLFGCHYTRTHPHIFVRLRHHLLAHFLYRLLPRVPPSSGITRKYDIHKSCAPVSILLFGSRFPYHLSFSFSKLNFHSWFFTYNFLSETIPKQDTQLAELGRRALLGFCSSAVSDTCSNSIRVVKVYKQSYPTQLSYMQVVRNVIAESGVTGLMFRGLETKILSNGLQGILFRYV